MAHLWTFLTKAQREAQTKNIYDDEKAQNTR